MKNYVFVVCFDVKLQSKTWSKGNVQTYGHPFPNMVSYCDCVLYLYFSNYLFLCENDCFLKHSMAMNLLKDVQNKMSLVKVTNHLGKLPLRQRIISTIFYNMFFFSDHLKTRLTALTGTFSAVSKLISQPQLLAENQQKNQIAFHFLSLLAFWTYDCVYFIAFTCKLYFNKKQISIFNIMVGMCIREQLLWIFANM